MELSSEPKPKVPKEQLKFGTTFTDHMLEVNWHSQSGWDTPCIHPYRKMEVDPAASVLHYALECFEGMKAYIDSDNNVRLFRPDMNMKRMQRSMKRLQLPEFPEDEFLACMGELLKVDKDWIPRGDGYSLYIRPTAISTHPFLGVGASSSAKMFVILSPVGPYYPEGFKPVSLLADTKHVRAWPGGTGDCKIGGNYAPTIQPQIQAAQEGYSQVLWLFGPDRQVTEVGTMNMFVFWKNEAGEDELVTAPLDGTILPGVTRQSILDLSRQWGEFKVAERTFTVDEVVRAADEGRIYESFGAGTAVVVSPIRQIHVDQRDIDIPLNPADPEAGAGPLAQRFWDTITGIQYGKIESEWSVVVQ